jgi:hypothetical protein
VLRVLQSSAWFEQVLNRGARHIPAGSSSNSSPRHPGDDARQMLQQGGDDRW